MKKDTLYLIIAAIIAWLLYRNYKKNQAKTTTETEAGTKTSVSSGGAGGVRPPQGNTTDPQDTEDKEEEVVVVDTIRRCPYCGTPNATLRQWKKGNLVIKSVNICPNKSCPGTYTTKKVVKMATQKTKFKDVK